MEFRRVPTVKTEGKVSGEWFEKVDILVAIDVLEDTTVHYPGLMEDKRLAEALVRLGVARYVNPRGYARVDPAFTQFAMEVRGAVARETAKTLDMPVHPPYVVRAFPCLACARAACGFGHDIENGQCTCGAHPRKNS